MTNGEKYKTPRERAEAFFKQRDKAWALEDAFAWLELEAKNEILPCPFCGGECVVDCDDGVWQLICVDPNCSYKSCKERSEEIANDKHNQVANVGEGM